jgi:hypothetical protein
MRDDTDAARALLAADRHSSSARVRTRRASEDHVLPGLSYDEMLAYALSLSLEEAAHRTTADAAVADSADTSMASTASGSSGSSGSSGAAARASCGDDSDTDLDTSWADDYTTVPAPWSRGVPVPLPTSSAASGAGATAHGRTSRRSSWRAFGSL